jgi:hypothetical protein
LAIRNALERHHFSSAKTDLSDMLITATHALCHKLSHFQPPSKNKCLKIIYENKSVISVLHEDHR